ncbi:MAG TPA: DUF6049 family protein [Acidimicrobiales bacterium]|nr:DUF6049 family protein [Acidimicrobiales bacterium]
MKRAAALAAALVTLALPAAGQSDGALGLRLASQTSWVGPGQDFVLRVRVQNGPAPPDTELAVSVYRRVSSRSEFARTVEGRVRGATLAVTATPLSELSLDPGGALLAKLPVQDPLQPADPTRLRLRDEGAYPVRVELRRVGGGPALAQLTTHLVYATPPTDGAPKLLAALVLPVHAPPALAADGRRRLTDAERDRLAALATALEAHAGIPLAVQPTPETLQALAEGDERDRETLATLREALDGRQVLGRTYVPTAGFADPAVLDEAAAQLQRGRQVLDDTLDRQPSAALAVVDEPLRPEVLQPLRGRGVERVVVPERLLAPVDLPVTLTQPFQLDTGDVRRLEAVAADPGLAAHFLDGTDPVLAAHHLLADLAVVALDRPGRARGVVLMPSLSWRPQRDFLDTLLGGLADAPVVAPATLDTLFADVPPATTSRNATLVRGPNPTVTDRPAPLPVERIGAERRRLRSFSGMLDSANPLDDRLEEQLLVSQSSELRARQRAVYLDGLARRVDQELSRVRVPEARTITLTARRGEIPVTVLSETGYPVRLEVRVTSDRLAFPDGGSRRIELARRNTTERFSVEARGSGAFPLRVRLFSPDGALRVGETRFTVRSTAFSGVGLVLSFGALGVLFAWWGRHATRSRRNRRLVPS